MVVTLKVNGQYDLFKWAGLKEKECNMGGHIAGNMWQLSIELNDGFQKKKGISHGPIWQYKR